MRPWNQRRATVAARGRFGPNAAASIFKRDDGTLWYQITIPHDNPRYRRIIGRSTESFESAYKAAERWEPRIGEISTENHTSLSDLNRQLSDFFFGRKR